MKRLIGKQDEALLVLESAKNEWKASTGGCDFCFMMIDLSGLVFGV